MKALITGAGGFCGTHLRNFLAGQGVGVYAMGRGVAGAGDGPDPGSAGIPSEISTLLKKLRPDYVFHLAGVLNPGNPAAFYTVNAGYGAALLEGMSMAELVDVPVLLVGTSAEYGVVSEDQLPITEDVPPRPYSHYGISKLAQTLAGLAAARQGVRTVIVRPGNIVGPGLSKDLVIGSFARQVARIMAGKTEPVIKVGNLKSVRDFIDIEDVVAVYWNLVRNPGAAGEIVNVCSGRGVLIEDALRKLIELSGMDIEVEVERSRLKDVDVPVHYGSTGKMKRLAGREATVPFEESLRRVLDHERGRA